MRSRTFLTHTVEHLYMGVLITAIYVLTAPLLVARGYAGIGALLFVELFVLTPLVFAHLWVLARREAPPGGLGAIIPTRDKIGMKSFSLWFVVGLIAIFVSYVPLYPVGIALRSELFAWLPEWYFNPGYGVTDPAVLAKLFLFAIVIDGIIAPTAEELFFRGYLLPRMHYLKGWAPIVNGALFGIYHFWQPHNLIALIVVGVILSYIVWKTNNVYLGIALHCTINVLGAVGGYFAIQNGIDIAR